MARISSAVNVLAMIKLKPEAESLKASVRSHEQINGHWVARKRGGRAGAIRATAPGTPKHF